MAKILRYEGEVITDCILQKDKKHTLFTDPEKAHDMVDKEALCDDRKL